MFTSIGPKRRKRRRWRLACGARSGCLRIRYSVLCIAFVRLQRAALMLRAKEKKRTMRLNEIHH